MLKSDGDEVIAAPMDSSRDLINSEATRLPESTAAMLCFVWGGAEEEGSKLGRLGLKLKPRTSL